jgi:hypothetical protein
MGAPGAAGQRTGHGVQAELWVLAAGADSLSHR